MGETEDHVCRGLAGMLLIDDAQSRGPELPSDYGVDDIPLIIQDKRLHEGGELDFGQSPVSPIGRLGDEIFVNGTHWPYLDVKRSTIRLRLLNASTARIYDIGFADGRRFDLIATEGGLLAAPRPMTRIPLSDARRCVARGGRDGAPTAPNAGARRASTLSRCRSSRARRGRCSHSTRPSTASTISLSG